ncbi:TPR repeat-containing protein (plasmid) [Gemmatirosa kalamazoonensis]|uniref:TPR repeat-containing protein n=1 Tax=Gemmatirosa kalamazoonensis TaxID=861299 RepID=W0RTX5_9BACT|nr:hypothetical protein [Gemmatirosa kalamazoonensis]AHG93745.1 TPR repeat-containing protein [Gemmatirosa kalamazoonensis]
MPLPRATLALAQLVLLAVPHAARAQSAATPPIYTMIRLADSLYRAKRWDAAADAYVRAATTGRSPLAVYNAGAVLARLGRADTALVWLRRAAALGVFSPDAFAGDSDLVALRGDARFAAVLDSARASWEPCARDENARRFDFWIGEWSVRNAQGRPVGQSSIQRVSGGCAILENWTGGTGVVGKSLNFYNHDTKQWQQYWVGQQGDQVLFTTSDWHGPTLTFHATTTDPSGTRALKRLSFTPVARDTVRQFSETSSDGGRTWSTEYDFYYARRP